ncbi:hypothetical protein NBRC116598_37790 [Pseudophaeobacter arcticus]|uniref:Integrase n=1 Tax=Pseudophaeobacter arcticus TaxID=385492 RepID=A0ABQ0ARF0_9RHOB
MAKRELPKYIYRQRNGLYFQRRGWLTRKVENEFGTAEFWREYADILADKDQAPRVTTRSFAALIKSYRANPRYRNLKPRTGKDYDKYLDFFQEIMGDRNPVHLKRKDVIRL